MQPQAKPAAGTGYVIGRSVSIQERRSRSASAAHLDARKHRNSHPPGVARILNQPGQECDVLTNGGTLNGATTPIRRPLSTAAGTQKVVIVDGSPAILELLENVLDAGRYDIVFVESSAHAYSQIKRVQPNLVILCVRIDSMETFQVLSMLKLDDDTRNIPVLTYTADVEGQATEDESEEEVSEAEIFASTQALRMN